MIMDQDHNYIAYVCKARGDWMSVIDVMTMSIKNLFKRKVRTLLTVLGVTIGTASIVLMISLGIAANMNFERQLENFGDVLNIEVFNWARGDEPPPVVLNDAMLDYISSWDGVDIAASQLNIWMQSRIGRRNASFTVIGIRPEAMPFLPGFRDIATGSSLESGGEPFQAVFGSEVPFEFMTERERAQFWRDQWGGGGGGGIIVRTMSDSVISHGMPGMFDAVQPERTPLVDIFNDVIEISYDWRAFFVPEEPTGPPDPNVPIIVINRDRPIYDIEAVGIFEGTCWETRNSIVMDIETVKQLINAREQMEINQGATWVTITDFDRMGFDRAIVRATDINTAIDVYERLSDMGFEWVWSRLGEIASLREMSNSLQNLLLIIGAVSLFVAFIGIANTMIMSIYERTKEIGVMKVIGAALSDIGKLFLFEAGLIGVIGGLVGLGLSFGLSYLLNNLEEGIAILDALIPHGIEGYTSYIPFWLYGTALAFSAVIGLIAGFIPAMRAMRISALTAIRTD